MELRGVWNQLGFPTDVIQSAGLAPLPMMEITPGEKDIVPWFDTRIGPKKYIASGAHLYGRNVVAVEAYTYIHWELYRATLEELKIASDGFFRSGANRFINHGYSYSPERDVTPSRSIPFAARISHNNCWWELLSITCGLCIPVFVFTAERPFHCRYRGVLASRQPMDIRCFERPEVDARI